MGRYNTPTFTEFENGLVVVNVANRLINTSTVGFIRGTRNDPPFCSGAAHLFEHEAIHGATENMIEKLKLRDCDHLPVDGRRLLRVMRRYLGGTDGPGMNVYTMYSHMSFGHQDLMHRHDLHVVFQAFAACVRDSIHDLFRMRGAEYLEPFIHNVERPAVDNETGGNDDDAYTYAWKTALRMLYRTNPARNFGDSDPRQIADIKLGRLKHWAQREFCASTMRVILLGPTSNEALRMVRDAKLDQLPKRKPRPFAVEKDVIPQLDGIRETVLSRPRARMTHMLLQWPTDVYNSSSALPLEVLEFILKERVEEELRDNNTRLPGGVYHPAAMWDATTTHGFMQLWFATAGGPAHAEELLERALNVIDDIKSDRSGLLEEDVEDARWNLATAFDEAYRYVPGVIADRMLEAMANGDPHLKRFQRYPYDMRKVKARQVREAAAMFLHRDRFVRVMVVP